MRLLGGKRAKIILGGALIVLLSAGVAAWQFQLLPVQATEEPSSTEEAASTGVGFPVKEQTINLADTNPPRFMKVEVVLEFAAGKPIAPQDSAGYKKLQERLREELSRQGPAIEDKLIFTLSSKKSSELLTQAGKEKVKQELIERIQPLVGERKLMNIYFRQFIIQ